MLKSESLTKANAAKPQTQWEPSFHVHENALWNSYKTKHNINYHNILRFILLDSKACIHMSIEALFIIVSIWKQATGPTVHLENGILFTAEKK